MEPTHSPSIGFTKLQYQLALINLKKAASDFSPGADARFLALKRSANDLRQQIYFAEQRVPETFCNNPGVTESERRDA